MISFWINETRLYVRAPYAHRYTCKGLPGARWDKNEKAWHLPATPHAAQAANRAFIGEREIVIADEAKSLFEQAAQLPDLQTIKIATDLPDIPAQVPDGGYTWLHQRRAFHFAKEHEGSMLAMDMGTGKSLVAIALLEEWQTKGTIILCPKNVMGVWPKQFDKHAIRSYDIVMPTKGSVAKRTAAAAAGVRLAAARGKPWVLIVNYESAWRKEMALLIKSLVSDTKPTTVILDESHRIKSAGGKASMFCAQLREMCDRRILATGTPMPHSPLDIYAQYRFADPGIFGTSKTSFMHRYAVMGGFENRQVVEWVNMDEFAEKFAQIAFMVSSEEALPDLPPYVHADPRTFELDHKTLKAYMGMAKEFVADVEGGIVTANNALTKLIRLRQITSGYIKTDEGDEVALSNGREDTLADVLEDIPRDEPVVVFAAFHHDLDAINRVCVKQGRRYGELSGRRRDGLHFDATMSPDIDVLGCQLQSGGVGIDLTRANKAIYYSMAFNLGDYEQSLKRIHRPGQHRPVTYLHLMATGPDGKPIIDGIMHNALKARKDLVSSVIEAAKRHTL